MNTAKNFHIRLHTLMDESNVTYKELALWMGVDVPTVSRWLNGASTPDVYQFRQIARFFGMPYEWFLDCEDDSAIVTELADRLGLSEDTVKRLMDLADTEDEEVLATFDEVLYTVIAAMAAMREGE